VESESIEEKRCGIAEVGHFFPFSFSPFSNPPRVPFALLFLSDGYLFHLFIFSFTELSDFFIMWINHVAF
jgi:hypothetical protein